MSLPPVQSSNHAPKSGWVQAPSNYRPPHLSVTSTLTECIRRRPWRISKWFTDLWKELCNWFRSWFHSKNSDSEPIYYKIATSQGGANKFRLLKDGKKTENAIHISRNSAQLYGISFPDRWAFDALPKMLLQIMEDEHIGSIHTCNLSSARHLWRAGLHTSTVFNIGIPGETHSDQYFIKLVQLACRRKQSLDDTGRKALEIVEEHIAMMLVSDGYNCTGNLSQTFQDEIFFFQHTFPGIDLYGAAKRLKNRHELPTVLAMLDHFMGEIERAYPHGFERPPPTVDLPFAALCGLSSSLKVPFGKRVCQSITSTITFTKDPPHED